MFLFYGLYNNVFVPTFYGGKVYLKGGSMYLFYGLCNNLKVSITPLSYSPHGNIWVITLIPLVEA